MSQAYPYASAGKIQETLDVLETSYIGSGENALKQILVALVATGTLTPPTVAPVLSVDADLGSFVANLSWTASNKTSSPGFAYRVYTQRDGGGYTAAGTTTSLTFNYDAGSTSGLYDFQVFPFNDSGEGVGSNVASVTLPGEPPEASYYRRPDGVSRYLRPDGLSYYLRP